MKKRYSIYAIPDHGEPVYRSRFASTVNANASADCEARHLLRAGATQVEIVLIQGRLAIEHRFHSSQGDEPMTNTELIYDHNLDIWREQAEIEPELACLTANDSAGGC